MRIGVEALIGMSVTLLACVLTVVLVPMPLPEPDLIVPGLLEAETLAVLQQSHPFHLTVQSTVDFRAGKWSHNSHLFASIPQLHDWVVFEVRRPPGVYLVSAYLTKAADYGVVRISVNGKALGKDIDLFSHDVRPTGQISLGEFTFSTTPATVRIEVVDKNPKGSPPYYQFGVDGILFEKTH